MFGSKNLAHLEPMWQTLEWLTTSLFNDTTLQEKQKCHINQLHYEFLQINKQYNFPCASVTCTIRASALWLVTRWHHPTTSMMKYTPVSLRIIEGGSIQYWSNLYPHHRVCTTQEAGFHNIQKALGNVHKLPLQHYETDCWYPPHNDQNTIKI